MGCVQAKSSTSSPPRGLEKLKLENGYAIGRRSYQRPPGKGSGRIPRPERTKSCAVSSALSDSGGKDGQLIERQGEGADVVSRRISTPRDPRDVGVDDLVDGWPRWLVDNIPREALVGLVPKSAESYDKLDKIGQGTYSNVYKARDRDTGKIVALKKVRFDTSESESVRFMAREIMFIQRLDHPNVVKLEGLATSRMQYSLYLVFDFMQSDLAKIIARPDGKLTEPQVKCYMQQLLSGLQHCHEQGILHRDIKGSNLLIDKSGMLKIADFGLANDFHPNQKRPLTSRVVTLWYRAPELLLGSTDYGVGIDLWSAGCLLAEMFAGRPIMPGRTEVEQLHRIFKLCGSPSEDYWRKLKLSTTFRPPQPYKPSILEVFRDFPTSSLGLLTTLLALDPAYRGSAASALQSEFFSSSPLACDLTGLPVIYKKEDDESIQSYGRKKNKAPKLKHRSHARREGQRKKNLDVEKSKGDSGSSKEGSENNFDPNMRNQETNSSAGSSSSGLKPRTREGSPHPSLSPLLAVSSLPKGLPKTECHPSATKNIKNFPLPSSKVKYGGNREGDDDIYKSSLIGRSASTSDFRKMDPEKISKLYALDN